MIKILLILSVSLLPFVAAQGYGYGGGNGGGSSGGNGGGYGGGYGHDYSHHPKYHFSYAVNDHKTGDVKHHKESRDGNAVHGEYALVEPDGSTRKVTYVADKGGFRAQVHRSPGHHGYSQGGNNGGGGYGGY